VRPVGRWTGRIDSPIMGGDGGSPCRTKPDAPLEEGLGFDGSPVAHMWRSIIWPNNFL
jgi:hypothetical protein